MPARFASRKFITTLAAQLAGLVVLFWPEYENQVAEVAGHIAALVVVLGSALGYVAAEASVDRQRAGVAPGADSSGAAADPAGELPSASVDEAVSMGD